MTEFPSLIPYPHPYLSSHLVYPWMNWCICAGLDDLGSRSNVLCVFGGKSNKVEDVLFFFKDTCMWSIQLFSFLLKTLMSWIMPIHFGKIPVVYSVHQLTCYITRKHPHLEECFTKYLVFLCARKIEISIIKRLKYGGRTLAGDPKTLLQTKDKNLQGLHLTVSIFQSPFWAPVLYI